MFFIVIIFFVISTIFCFVVFKDEQLHPNLNRNYSSDTKPENKEVKMIYADSKTKSTCTKYNPDAIKYIEVNFIKNKLKELEIPSHEVNFMQDNFAARYNEALDDLLNILLERKVNKMIDTETKTIPYNSITKSSAEILVEACHHRAWNNGWWHDIETGAVKHREVPELLCLIHSEISEALEGYRKDLNDDHLPERKMLEVELADAVIRIFDMAGGLDLDIAGAIVDKLNYNDKREDHKLVNRTKENGKKI